MTMKREARAREDAMDEAARILEGIRVVDCATFIAAPVATTVMADFGADVVKVESPDGDPFRNSWRSPGNPVADVPYNWHVDNRSKRGIAVDLKNEEGRAILHRLVERADVFVTNMPLQVRERLAIRWRDLEPINPRLVYASVSAYGEAGPEANRTGFDSTALWARTGLMDLVKPSPDSAPARSLPAMGDHPSGVSLFAAIMTALWRRERTGRGGRVSTSLMANGLWWNAIWTQAVLSGATVRGRPPREEATNALHNLYCCRDGRWFHLVLITQPDRKWPLLVELLEDGELARDPRFATEELRRANPRPLIEALDRAFARRDWAEWRERLDRAGITYGQVARIDDVLEDVQMKEGGALEPVSDSRIGAEWTVSSPLQVGEGRKAPPRAAPGLGEHTDAVLGELGYDEATIARMTEAGVVVRGGG